MDSGDLHALDVRISALEAELQRWASGDGKQRERDTSGRCLPSPSGLR
jgi:hypothetical protein